MSEGGAYLLLLLIENMETSAELDTPKHVSATTMWSSPRARRPIDLVHASGLGQFDHS